MKDNPKVIITNHGCSIFPHGSIHEILSENNDSYLTAFSYVDKSWCENYDSASRTLVTNVNDGKVLEMSTSCILLFKGEYYDFNKILRLGYYSNGKKTDFFTIDFYQQFELKLLEKRHIFEGSQFDAVLKNALKANQ